MSIYGQFDPPPIMTNFTQKQLHLWGDFYTAIGIELTEKQREQFKQFYTVLIEINQSTNLTRITEEADFVQKHLLDSLCTLPFISEATNGKQLLDVGSGGGFPCIPLAIALPYLKVVALDATQKKMAAVTQIKEALGLDNLSTISGRAEELAQKPQYREQFDFVTARAVASLPILLELCLPYVKPQGQFFAYKTAKAIENESYDSNAVNKLLGGQLREQVAPFKHVPELNEHRLLIFNKLQKTNKAYPRRYAQIQKTPLL